ncbi:alpha/beta fold hydrolase [Lewinella sp. W8]|uniref:alpha/beta fold hydrolase n=1 Tax=Lewinella sp. W8 TaxID=2528208 RepID=UPI0010674598|nr:alpha/beta fold hydrolase [Lewinella sp. W8]MTB51534.1 alpha/beta fold hydrolase [Lewinella sp. W8]
MIKFLHVQGYRIAYREAGRGDCVLFLHGWPTNSLLWEAHMDALKSTHRVVAIDWIGFGRSDKPDGFDYSFSSMARVLDQVIAQLLGPEEQFTLVGHDIGGPPAILWAAKHPQRLRHLILLNTVLYTLHTPLDRISEVLFKLPGLRHVFASDLGLRTIMLTNTRNWRSGLWSRIGTIVASWRSTSTNFTLRMIAAPMERGRAAELRNLSDTLRGIPVSKHLIIAPGDPLCGRHMLRFREEAPDLDVHILRPCGHYMPLDQPQLVNGALRSILDQ